MPKMIMLLDRSYKRKAPEAINRCLNLYDQWRDDLQKRVDRGGMPKPKRDEGEFEVVSVTLAHTPPDFSIPFVARGTSKIGAFWKMIARYFELEFDIMRLSTYDLPLTDDQSQDFHFLLQDPPTPEGFQKGFRRGL